MTLSLVLYDYYSFASLFIDNDLGKTRAKIFSDDISDKIKTKREVGQDGVLVSSTIQLHEREELG
jgi:hypothetical protein